MKNSKVKNSRSFHTRVFTMPDVKISRNLNESLNTSSITLLSKMILQMYVPYAAYSESSFLLNFFYKSKFYLKHYKVSKFLYRLIIIIKASVFGYTDVSLR